MSIRDAMWDGISRADAIEGQWTAVCLAALVALFELATLMGREPVAVRDRDATWRTFQDARRQVADMPVRPPMLTRWLERTRAVVDAADQLRREALSN
jgi:hypothetical protein